MRTEVVLDCTRAGCDCQRAGLRAMESRYRAMEGRYRAMEGRAAEANAPTVLKAINEGYCEGVQHQSCNNGAALAADR